MRVPSPQHPRWFSKRCWKHPHVDPDLRASPYIHMNLPVISPEPGAPMRPCQPDAPFKPAETVELFEAPNFTGVSPPSCWWVWICHSAGPSVGAGGGCGPSPRHPRHAGLVTPPVKIVLTAALVLSLGTTAVTKVTHSHSAFSGISLESN